MSEATDARPREAKMTLEARVRERTEELRDANRRLREQEAFLRSIYNEVELAIYVIDVLDGFRHLEVNPAFVRMTGIKREHIIGKRLEELEHLSEKRRASLLAHYENVVRSAERLDYEVMSPLPDGDSWWLVTLNPVQTESGEVYRIIGTGLPITERKLAELELNREKEFNESLIRSSVDGILAFDKELRYTVFNEGMTRISGVTAKDALGKHSYEVFPFLEEIGEVEVQRATLRGERSVRHDQHYRIPETNREGYFEAYYAPLLAVDGEVSGGLAVVRDISERKRVEDELRKMQLKLSEVRDEERLALARDLHDGVMQELLGINQHLALLEKSTQKNAKLSAAISAERKNILKTVNQLRGTVRDLRPPGLEDFGLSKTLQSLVEESRARVGANGPELTADIDPTTGLEPQLSRALYHVAQEGLRNALRHACANNVQLNLHLEEDKLVLSITDDGVGFVRPERLNQFAENDHFGLLGAEERMRLLHGELEIISEQGEGTTLLAKAPLELDANTDTPLSRSKHSKGDR